MNLDEIEVFDSLMHISDNGEWFDTGIKAGVEQVFDQFESHKTLAQALLVGLPGNSNDYIADVCNQSNGRLIPIAAFDWVDDINGYLTKLKSQGFYGVKVHPRLLETNLTDPRIIEIVRAAHANDMVTLICTTHRSPSPPINMPVSEALYKICVSNPEARIILVHGGYYDLLATSEMIRPFENVLLDLSSTIPRFMSSHILSDLIFLFETFDQRICIGSDFPENTISDVVASVEKYILPVASVSKASLSNIFYHNLHQFICNN